MPLLLQKHITDQTKLAVWKIEEDEVFFLRKITLQQSIHHPHKRLQHLAGRYLLSLLFPDFPYDEVLISEAGKPYLPSGQYFFSISHCGNYAAVIVSPEIVAGIDIELFSPKTERVKHKYLSDDELAYLIALQKEEKQLVDSYGFYTLCWCAKEAVYKWWGNGKLDFKKNIVIGNIDMVQQKIKVFFSKELIQAELSLHFLLLQQLSIVWTESSKNH